MITLNTYSFALRMGLLNNKERKWTFEKFLNFCKKKKLKKIEFPIDYFSKIEKRNFEYYFELLKSYNLDTVVALENFEIKYIKKLIIASKKYDLKMIRIKMSNNFGGNRYKQKDFYILKKKFIKKLQKIKNIINKTNLKIAIENHQDLSSQDLIKIIRDLKCKNLGLTWDIGNSLATCETPDQFFDNTKNYIFNAHCKNYKIILSNNGFFLKRAKINEGSINIKKYIKFFKKKEINISLELAAHVNRHCDLYEKNFLKHHKIKGNKLKDFNKYILKNSTNDTPFTNWEVYRNIDLTSKNELDEFNHSLKELRKYG